MKIVYVLVSFEIDFRPYATRTRIAVDCFYNPYYIIQNVFSKKNLTLKYNQIEGILNRPVSNQHTTLMPGGLMQYTPKEKKDRKNVHRWTIYRCRTHGWPHTG